MQEITLWRKGEKSRKSQSASPHLPSHLVSAETGFPQGAAHNGPSVVRDNPRPQQQPDDEEEAGSPSGDTSEEPQQQQPQQPSGPIEGMTREEGDGEGDKDLSPESQ